MKNMVLAVIMVFTLCVTAGADEWRDLLDAAMEQAPSRSKRRTSSGKRLLREKARRVNEINAQVPVLVRRGNYGRAEELLREGLKLTAEYYGGAGHLDVAEKFMSLGIVYMEAGEPGRAVSAFEWARRIGESVAGEGDARLLNIYRFLAAAYYESGDYRRAEESASTLLAVSVSNFGPRSEQARDAKNLLRKITERSTR